MRRCLELGLAALLLLAWGGGPVDEAREDDCRWCEGIGTPVTDPAQIAAWNITIPPDGHGLPEGRGTALEGRRIFEFGPSQLLYAPDGRRHDPALRTTCPGGPSKCALCHGEGGKGGQNAPQLVGGRNPMRPPSFPVDPGSAIKTVGSYWPYATTLFDYIRRAMPFDCPGSLTDDEVYSVTAYLLFLNGIIAGDEEMNERRLPKINARMPNHDYFYHDPRPYLPKGPDTTNQGATAGSNPGS